MKRILTFAAIMFGYLALAQDVAGDFKIEVCQDVDLGYLLHRPGDLQTKKPLIVFLHGSGEKGTDVEKVKVHGPFKYLKTGSIDAYILAPQCRENEYWEPESIYLLIQRILKENKNIDTKRIYLTGLSLGGWGTFKLGMAHPEMFAALVPICGFTDRLDRDDACKIKDIPTRIYHGVLDDVVSPDYAMSIYKTLKACGGNVSLTLFDDANHDSWSRVYNGSEVYAWMLSQTKP